MQVDDGRTETAIAISVQKLDVVSEDLFLSGTNACAKKTARLLLLNMGSFIKFSLRSCFQGLLLVLLLFSSSSNETSQLVVVTT
jgi:hypothetical protein